MDTRTGDLYPSKAAALEAGVPEEHIVEIRGPKKAIGRVRMACRQAEARRAKKRRQQKASRRRNR